MEDSLQQMPGSDMGEQTTISDQGSDNPVDENSARQNTQMTCRVELKIPVAVFTAHRGYDWSQLPDFVSVDEADGLFEKIMSVKTTYHEGLLPIGDAFKGVLYTAGGRYAFAFRLMTVERWDQAKRNGNYCACAFVTCDKFKDVDFERLLDMPYFLTPSRSPVATLDYYDEDFHRPLFVDWSPIVSNFKANGKQDFDWRMIGTILDEFRDANDKWFFARINSRGESRFVPEFGTWDERFFEPRALENENTEEARYEGIPNGSTVVKNDPVVSQSLPATQDVERQDLESLGEYGGEDRNNDELTVDKERFVNLTAENKELAERCQEIYGRFDTLSRNFQAARQERDAAQRSCRSLQLRIKTLEMRVGDQCASVNWYQLMLAFLLGVVVAVVILLAIQLASNSNCDDRSTYAEDRHEEGLQ